MNNRGQGAARLVVFFCAGLLLFTGCKDLFHPDEQETDHTVDHTVYYTVTFDANWGSPEIQTRTVQSGSTVGYSNMPSEPTMSGYTFDGWYRLDWNGDEPQATLFTAFTPVYGNIIVYASWMAVQMSSNLSLNDALTWISNNAVTGDTYTITLWNNETIAPKSLSYSGKTVSITLTGGTTEWTVNLSTIGSLFTVGSGVTLTLGNNVTLWGRNDNTASLVTVNSGGNLVMESGSKITRNTGRSTQTGYGVDGGGVHIESGGIFTMNGGIINNNFVAGDGGGVNVRGRFIMNGGEISSNTSDLPGFWNVGGGVSVTLGEFTMNGGVVSGNTSSVYGGGVYVYNASSFTMNGGTISANNSVSGGGGVAVDQQNNGVFTKTGGIIYGSDASSALKNTATNSSSSGHAVYVITSPARIRNTTAGSGITLNSAVSGPAGGWE